MNTNVRLSGVHVGPNPDVRPKPVTDCVFDAQRDEVEAAQWTPDGRHLDADGPLRVEQVTPGHGSGALIDVLLALIIPFAEPPQDAARNTAFQVGTVAGAPIPNEPDACVYRLQFLRPKAGQLGDKNGLQPTRAGRKKV